MTIWPRESNAVDRDAARRYADAAARSVPMPDGRKDPHRGRPRYGHKSKAEGRSALRGMWGYLYVEGCRVVELEAYEARKAGA